MRSWSVTEVNSYIKTILSNDIMLKKIQVDGEVCSFKQPSANGHCYFEIKDNDSRIKCVFLRIVDVYDKVPFKEGDNVTITGFIDVYEKTGVYQLRVDEISIEGEGLLYKEFLKLREKLSKEGLFDLCNREIPSIPRKIGLITSKRGAAVNDVINTIKRRFPLVKIILYPVQVQGIYAVDSIIKGIDYFDNSDIDVLLITRGGGSYEELAVFNDEKLARRIVETKHPTISAIGHAEDFFISDFCADKRCDTPTAAAETLSPDLSLIKDNIRHLENRTDKTISRYISIEKRHLELLNTAIKQCNPKAKLINSKSNLFYINKRFSNAISKAFQSEISNLNFYSTRLNYIISNQISYNNIYLKNITEKFNTVFRNRLNLERKNLNNYNSRIISNDLYNLLDRGFTITFDQNKNLIKDINDLKPGTKIFTKLKDKTIISIVEEVTDWWKN